MNSTQFLVSVGIVPLTTMIAVLVGVWLHARIVNRRTEEIKDLIKSCAERYDAKLLRFEERVLGKIAELCALRSFERHCNTR